MTPAIWKTLQCFYMNEPMTLCADFPVHKETCCFLAAGSSARSQWKSESHGSAVASKSVCWPKSHGLKSHSKQVLFPTPPPHPLNLAWLPGLFSLNRYQNISWEIKVTGMILTHYPSSAYWSKNMGLASYTWCISCHEKEYITIFTFTWKLEN